MGPFAPPPALGSRPPPLWGSEERARELFGDRVEFRTLEHDVLGTAESAAPPGDAYRCSPEAGA